MTDNTRFIDDANEAKHAEMVQKLAKDGVAIAAQLTPVEADVWHHATGVATEAGELLDIVKKLVIYRRPPDVYDIVEELGDIEFYLAGIRQIFGISRAQTLMANMHKLGKRYPEYRYTDERAVQRADKHEDNTDEEHNHDE